MSLDFYLECAVDTGNPELTRVSIFDANITHNLHAMWEEAGVYDALYNCQGKKAAEIVPALEAGLRAMRADPPRFRKHDAPNGWGLYEHAVPFLEAVLEACQKYPKAVIRVSK